MYKGAGRLANIVEFKVPRRLDNSLIVTYSICRNHLKSFDFKLTSFEIDSTFLLRRDNVIFTEHITITKNSSVSQNDFLYLSQS